MEFITDVKLRTNDPVEATKAVKEVLKNNKVVKVVPEWYLGDLRAFYEVLTDEIGIPINIGEDFKNEGAQTHEKWLEIRYDADIPDLSAYRHSKNAQPLHTDESYIKDPADIMLFYSINKAIKGGATTFVDGPVLLEYMEENAPELLEKLKTTPVRYKKANEERTEKIIDIKEDGEIHFNFNYYCVDKDETEENKALNKEFFDFLQNYVAHSHMVEQVVLNPGEAVLWWDELVLHGRTSYDVKKTNDRFIWKTGFKWKE
ncbi:taurine catabolism dioxygenase TauD, TfdA family [Kordia sp. SMS9]|uniref:TauD/TfdA family dioxygenase n=1 Tax=Kordia sp. SMS9 TaxID=2282170 RepID=UPI000E0D3B82|nr:TauD/TfdA family dioxygenase [Kordia sp. SMS9]AXG68981.1 taurine catabolism dioxygenase TauD, TfdA family [Kordia sp. SMS9]